MLKELKIDFLWEISKFILFSGFGFLWYEKTAEAFIMHSYVMNQDKQQKTHRKPFSLKDIQTPFYILIVGYIISFIVFLIETFLLSPEKLKNLQTMLKPVDSDNKKNRRNRFQNQSKRNWSFWTDSNLVIDNHWLCRFLPKKNN